MERSLNSFVFFFSSRRRHTRLQGDWSSDVCSSDLGGATRNRRDEGRQRRSRLAESTRLARIHFRSEFVYYSKLVKMDELIPRPTAHFRRRSWLEFQRALDPLAPPRPVPPMRTSDSSL